MRRRRGDAHRVAAVGRPLEQEEAVEIGPCGRHDLPGGIDQLEIQPFEAQSAILDDRAFDVAGADQSDIDLGGNAGPRHHHLDRFFRREHRVGHAGLIDSDRQRRIGRKPANRHRPPGVGRLGRRDEGAFLQRLAGIVDAIVVEIPEHPRPDDSGAGQRLPRQVKSAPRVEREIEVEAKRQRAVGRGFAGHRHRHRRQTANMRDSRPPAPLAGIIGQRAFPIDTVGRRPVTG
ncbi:MAG: hypothetical protein WKF52_03920 [Sphingomicrobium sp.]